MDHWFPPLADALEQPNAPAFINRAHELSRERLCEIERLEVRAAKPLTPPAWCSVKKNFERFAGKGCFL
jgi:hypothetical protein